MRENEENYELGSVRTTMKTRKVSLKNQGGYVVRMDFVYADGETGDIKRVAGSRRNIALGNSEIQDPGAYGVPNGAAFTVHGDVVMGKDATGAVWLIYDQSSGETASFTASGAVFNSSISFTSLK